MKRAKLSILLLMILIAIPCSAQTLGDEGTHVLSYIQKAMNFNRTTPQEKVYLHFDNTGYFESETIWFKAYVTRTDISKGTNLSKVLYVELLNPSGDVLKTTKWPIDSLGQANGDLKLDTLFGSGFYEVRAYTRYMTNWGVNACFSRVFPVFSAPKTEGDYHDLSIKTRLYKERDPNNRDRSDSLYLKAIDEGIYTSELMKSVSVQFYPEGGDLVRGIDCRVAMLAVDDNGRPYQGEGFVTNEKGDMLASVTTDTLGRGLFTIRPDGTKLTFQIKNSKGKTQYFDLPNVKAEGVALKFDAINDDMLVTLQSTDAVCGRLLGYTIINNGNITFCDTIMAQPLIEIELDRSRQHEGVNQLTLFDSEGHILAERLYFICPQATPADSIRITSRTARLKPCGSVVLDVQTRPNATFSFSAIDAKNMTNGKQGNMKTWMLLSSEVRGYIHNVDYYFEADDPTHRKSADLLMMTQGWRRYDWELMTGQKRFDKIQPIEDKFYIFGKLNQYRKRNPANNVAMEVYLFNQHGESLVGKSVTDEQGHYAFQMPFVDGEWRMQIFTRLNDKRKTYYVGIDRQFSPVPRFVGPLESQITHPLKPNMFVLSQNNMPEEAEPFVPITERNHLLQNVEVKAKRRYFTNDDWYYKNEGYGRQNATLFYNIEKELDAILDNGEAEPTLFEWLSKKNSLFKYDVKMPHERATYASDWVKYILNNDDRPGDDSIYNINVHMGTNDYWMHDIRTMYIAPHSTDNLMVKVDADFDDDVCARFYLYTKIRWSTESQKGLRHSTFYGFNKPSAFKMEDYSILPPMADFRRTIYWAPTVSTDSEGRAKVEFYNNSTCEEMYISAEGMGPDGEILVKE